MLPPVVGTNVCVKLPYVGHVPPPFGVTVYDVISKPFIFGTLVEIVYGFVPYKYAYLPAAAPIELPWIDAVLFSSPLGAPGKSLLIVTVPEETPSPVPN